MNAFSMTSLRSNGRAGDSSDASGQGHSRANKQDLAAVATAVADHPSESPDRGNHASCVIIFRSIVP
eukprot:6803404-Alexandrium_andersonii.AAC.1